MSQVHVFSIVGTARSLPVLAECLKAPINPLDLKVPQTEQLLKYVIAFCKHVLGLNCAQCLFFRLPEQLCVK